MNKRKKNKKRIWEVLNNRLVSTLVVFGIGTTKIFQIFLKHLKKIRVKLKIDTN